jgi:hypothetical protein
MRKLQVVGFALLAVLAVTAFAASAALGDSTMLWLVAGANIEGAEEKATESTGELTLTDLKAPGGAVAVVCSGKFVGKLLSEGKDTVTEVNNLAGTLKNEIECAFGATHGLCETSMAPIVKPSNLPWTSELSLVGAAYVDTLKSATTVGYDVVCLTILGETLDECTAATGKSTEVNVTGGVEGTFAEENTGNCTLSKELSGDVAGKGLTTSSAGAVTVSEP